MPIPLLKCAAAYIRVSDERQDEYSPDSQLKKIREYASKEGYAIPDEYVFYDDGISARNTKRRKEFNRMIAIAKDKDHPFDTIYVWKFSRFARNQEQSMVYKNLLRKKNVSVVSVSEPIPDGHYGTLIERIIEWMDEFYSINLGAEVKRGMEEKTSRGEPTCPAPYGYVMQDKKFLPDESGPADIVREIFQRYVNGEREREIAVAMGNKGVRTKQGNLPENRWIKYILNNPCYIGKLRRSTDSTRAISKRKYKDESVLVVDGKHVPIITQELWDKAQKIIEERKALYPRYAKSQQPVQHMLKGILRCGACGATLAMGTKGGKNGAASLQCCNYAKGTCRISHSITIPIAESLVISALEEAVKTCSFIIDPPKEEKSEAFAAPDFEKLIRLERNKLQRAKDAFLAGIDTLEQYAVTKAEIEKQINALEEMKQSTVSPPKVDTKAFAKKISELLDYIKDENTPIEAKNKSLHSVIAKIIYHKETKSFSIHFKG